MSVKSIVLLPVFLMAMSGGDFQISLIKPQTIRQTAKNRYFVDFGKDAFGTLALNITPSRPDTLIIHLGEKCTGAGAVDRNPGGTIRYQKIVLPVNPSQSEYVLQLQPDQRNTNPPAVALPDSFGVIMPFRYCEIENLSIPLTGEMICQKTFHYAFNDEASSFTSSDTVLNQVWDLCKYTMKATSFCGLYIDGDRERIPYEADALINQLGHYAVDNNYSLARRTNEYFLKHPTWPTEWILQTAFLFYYDYLYTGDISPIAENYEALKAKSLTVLAREDGLISTKSGKLTDEVMGSIGFSDRSYRIRDIVDWPGEERDGYELTDINTVVNAFYYKNLMLMSEIAGYLDKKEDQKLFAEKAETVKNALNRKLFDAKKGIYLDGENSGHSSIHANLFPLAFGLVPDKHLPSVTGFIKSRGMACSVYAAQFLLEGLYGSGEAGYAQSLMASTGERSWWNMIREGSTITMEAWGMKYKANGDWNHAWGAAPANIITRCLWGITPASPGFARARICPQPGNLKSSSIKVPTLKGAIHADYKLISNKFKVYTIQLPPDMGADFVVSPDEDVTVFVNNVAAKPTKNIISLNPGLNRITIKKDK